MNLNSFTWNNGSYDNPVVLPEENIVTLLKAKTQLTETQFNVGGHVISESGASYNHRIHNLKIEYPELNVHFAGSNCQIHQDTDISSHNVYNPDEVPDAESATAQNTTILLTNSDIGRHGLNMTTAENDADFEYSFRAAYIDPTNINFNPVAYIRAHSHRYVGK